MKKLQGLRDRLQLQREDIEYTQRLLGQEERELAATQEQVAAVQEKVRTNLRGLASFKNAAQTASAGANHNHHEDEALRHTFKTILDHAIKDLRSDMQQRCAAGPPSVGRKRQLRVCACGAQRWRCCCSFAS